MAHRRIAVVGSGIAGLGAAWLLSRRHEVVLFEADSRLGGHTHTVDCDLAGGRISVDTGFIVYNEANYPHLTALFATLGVPTRPSDMSFAFSASDIDLEYAGDNLNTLFAQRRNLLRPAFWRMAGDILRFNREGARALATDALDHDEPLSAFLDRIGLGEAFRRYYLLPMSAAIWSCPPERMLAFPAASLLRFFANHGLIRLSGRPQWRTVTGGARRYIEAMRPDLGEVRTGSPVTRIRRDGTGVHLHGPSGGLGRFDDVVIAAHADQALAMLEQPSRGERTVLGRFHYQANEAWLHQDPALMPRRRTVWSSWNHLTTHAADGSRPVSVTYWMNRLQRPDTDEPLFVSLNPVRPPAPDRVIRRLSYDHPVFDGAAMRAQAALPRLQGDGGVWFCGSYCGYGFHEDALASAVAVAGRLGCAPPWTHAVQRDGGNTG
ncbi:hypothetical protein KBTX_02861 [wastewater metagenome]|uniref:Amine oxidase domain-containing protein n=2 Tax=unclassified sequences TaxID=12908 RepID=A0A5B8RD55_9ZZZZ|nr:MULTISPECIES: FAD-dependent oxidoreductase [Arhodomonas]MCS4502881.1 FAD-dependent oxidoreductase [Arhodomonas aquaeolei]QEA06521.1 hypothetical protein KBTEX_02861 [uncultured organism]